MFLAAWQWIATAIAVDDWRCVLIADDLVHFPHEGLSAKRDDAGGDRGFPLRRWELVMHDDGVAKEAPPVESDCFCGNVEFGQGRCDHVAGVAVPSRPNGVVTIDGHGVALLGLIPTLPPTVGQPKMDELPPRSISLPRERIPRDAP